MDAPAASQRVFPHQSPTRHAVTTNLRVNTSESASLPHRPRSAKPYAYVFYITSNKYACAALQLIDRLVNRVAMDTTRIDLVVLHTGNVAATFLSKMENLMHARTIQVDPIRAKSTDPTWRESLTKLRAFQDWGYDRVVFLDSDATPLVNIDDLFDLPPAPLYAPIAYWLPQPFFASTLMVIEPSNDVFEDIVRWAEARGRSAGFDMDILNAYFVDKVHYLPGEFTVLNSDFRQPPTAANNLFNTTTELKAHTKVVHFSCKPDGSYGKPWLWPSHDLSLLDGQDFDPLFRELFEQYWQGEQALCGL